MADTTDTSWTPTAFPVEFLALGGVSTGVPVRATMTGFGPTLLSKVLALHDTQESSLNLVFHFADKAGLALAGTGDTGRTGAPESGGAPPATKKPKNGPVKVAKPKAAAPAKDADSGVEKMLKSTAFKSVARSAATVLGREITRGLFGTRKR